MKNKVFLLATFMVFLLSTTIAQARVTPEDILNEKRAVYNQRVANYSTQSKQKLTTFDKKVADLNKAKTDELSVIMERQGEILDEYVYRQGYAENGGNDGINRNLSNDVENTRYWITYAHEAVAYQAAKVYVFDLTGEASANRDITSTINSMQSDLNTLRSKVIKSHTILEALISK